MPIRFGGGHSFQNRGVCHDFIFRLLIVFAGLLLLGLWLRPKSIEFVTHPVGPCATKGL